MRDRARGIGIIVVIVAALAGCGGGSDGGGATIEVRPGDSLEDAVAGAAPGDTVVIHPGTYDANLDLRGKPITLRSTDPNDPAVVAATILDGGRRDTVLRLGFADPGGGATGVRPYSHHDTLIVVDGLTFFRGQTDGDGGGLWIDARGPGRIEIRNSIIGGNIAAGSGGGAYVLGAGEDTAELVATGNSFLENIAGLDGGGLAFFDTDGAVVASSSFERNMAGGDGGGLSQSDSILTQLEESVVRDNRAARYGGGIAETSPTRDGPAGISKITVLDSVVADNWATAGGGTFVQVSEVEVVRTGHSGNSATGSLPMVDFTFAPAAEMAAAAEQVTVTFTEHNATDPAAGRGGAIAVAQTSSTLSAGAVWRLSSSADFGDCPQPLEPELSISQNHAVSSIVDHWAAGLFPSEQSPYKHAESHRAALDCLSFTDNTVSDPDGAVVVFGSGWALVDADGNEIDGLPDSVTFSGNTPRDVILPPGPSCPETAPSGLDSIAVLADVLGGPVDDYCNNAYDQSVTGGDHTEVRAYGAVIVDLSADDLWSFQQAFPCGAPNKGQGVCPPGANTQAAGRYLVMYNVLAAPPPDPTTYPRSLLFGFALETTGNLSDGFVATEEHNYGVYVLADVWLEIYDSASGWSLTASQASYENVSPGWIGLSLARGVVMDELVALIVPMLALPPEPLYRVTVSDHTGDWVTDWRGTWLPAGGFSDPVPLP